MQRNWHFTSRTQIGRTTWRNPYHSFVPSRLFPVAASMWTSSFTPHNANAIFRLRVWFLWHSPMPAENVNAAPHLQPHRQHRLQLFSIFLNCAPSLPPISLGCSVSGTTEWHCIGSLFCENALIFANIRAQVDGIVSYNPSSQFQ